MTCLEAATEQLPSPLRWLQRLESARLVLETGAMALALGMEEARLDGRAMAVVSP